jgi:hypothetical protein
MNNNWITGHHMARLTCPSCEGTGRVEDAGCAMCDGRGYFHRGCGGLAQMDASYPGMAYCVDEAIMVPVEQFTP